VAECAAHRHDLAFVVEGVGKDVMQDERWSADGAVSVRKMKFGVGVQSLVSESAEVEMSSLTRLMLQANGISDSGTCDRVAIHEIEPLERADPEPFAVEDVDDLLLQGREAETGQFLCVGVGRQSGQVIENESDGSVSPMVEFANAIQREHSSLS